MNTIKTLLHREDNPDTSPLIPVVCPDHQNKTILLKFPAPKSWHILTPDLARDLAKSLTIIANAVAMNQAIEIPSPVNGTRAYCFGGCAVMIAMEPSGPMATLLWHMSISHPTRYPTWDEIRDARYTLCPKNITMAMLLPPENEYVNAHPNCFHLYEIKQ
jgi:hypothetical protein